MKWIAPLGFVAANAWAATSIAATFPDFRGAALAVFIAASLLAFASAFLER